MTQPQIESRHQQPYVGIRTAIATMAQFRDAADSGFPELFRWLGTQAAEPAGPPFIRYIEISAADEPREIELGVPVGAPTPGNGGIRSGSLPAGRYATLVHVGPYASAEAPDLASARARLLRFIDERTLDVECTPTADGSRYDACLESYLTNARLEPDPSRWRTELAYLLAGTVSQAT